MERIFFSEDNWYSKVNRNIYKPPVTEDVKEIVRKNFTRYLFRKEVFDLSTKKILFIFLTNDEFPLFL